ncbi:MAG TPA: N-acetylmuramoyl-L-alanine amidase [Micromonosporaceae bacterium]
MRTLIRSKPVVALAVGALGALLVLPIRADATQVPTTRAAQFAAAAKEFGVPLAVLEAVSYNESQFDFHAGKPSTSGSYGPMGLIDVPASSLNQRGDGVSRTADAPALHTATTAAKLIGTTTTRVTGDAATNIRAGAALLASYAHQSDKTDIGGWYGAVAHYSGATSSAGQKAFADDVFATIRGGAHAVSDDGGPVTIAAQPSVKPQTSQVKAPASTSAAPQCPKSLDCDYIPAAYALNDPSDPSSYGNYDMANRPRTPKITTIVLHDTESSYDSTVNEFTDSAAYVSANYVVRSADGHVTQMVPDQDIAWHAGNWYVNMHSIGIEQEGYAISGATWFTEQLYHSTATLVKYLSAKYDIPLDRQHIIGHDNVPGITPAGIPGMHWDPGPFWDWNHFMALIGAPVHATGLPGSQIVTVDPNFATNIQTVTDCEGSTTVAPQASSFVPLYTAPSTTAPLFSDPGLFPSGGGAQNCADNWGNKASAGQQFVVAARQGDWIAIWWDGAEVWLQNPSSHRVLVPASGFKVVPKPGVTSVATYGRAYPEASAYPSDVTPQPVVPLNYTITPGQGYVFGGVTPTDYYMATTIDGTAPGDRTDFVGTTKYYEIQLGHRIAYVQASDVRLVPVV